MKITTSPGGTTLDIGLPTPAEVAQSLGGRLLKSNTPHEQAVAIAEEVYQPIRDMLRELALRGVHPDLGRR